MITKKTALVAATVLSSMTIAAYGSLLYLGLDNDGVDSLDPVLETKQVDEELGFRHVAQVIETFVRRQLTIRQSSKANRAYAEERRRGEEGEATLIYKDLPQAQAYATRDVHRKTHGCAVATLEVSSSLDRDFNRVTEEMLHERKTGLAMPGPYPELIQNKSDLGIFQPGATYDAVVRFSNGHPGNRPDRLPDARGFAVKLLRSGVLEQGRAVNEQSLARLISETELDILSINFPTFFVNEKDTASKYLLINEYFLDGAVDFAGTLKSKLAEGASVYLSGINGLERRAAFSVNGSIIHSPLFQEYFSMVPSRLGPPGARRAVKYYWAPEACPGTSQWAFETKKEEEWPQWAKERHYADVLAPVAKYWTPPYSGTEQEYPRDYLRRNLDKTLREGDFCFGLYFQPYRDQVSTNIEDSTDIWFRDEEQKNWWLEKVVPGPLRWRDSSERQAYLNRLERKAVVPAVKAAVLRLNRFTQRDQVGNSQVCEDLSFNPWNGNIEYHKPLGVISRLKRRVYNASRKVRHALNGLKTEAFERKQP